jgi:hypothetical protein
MNSLKSFVALGVTGSSGSLSCSHSKSYAPLLVRSSSTIMLFRIMPAIIMYLSVSSFQNHAGPHIIANRA